MGTYVGRLSIRHTQNRPFHKPHGLIDLLSQSPEMQHNVNLTWCQPSKLEAQ